MSEADPAPQRAPLFLLSFRQRDELAAAAGEAGWRVVAARRADGVARRFAASGAAVALVDARGAVDEGLAAVEALGQPVLDAGAALLVLISRNDTERLGEFHRAGATHFLSSPMRTAELVQALRFAERHVERLGGWDAHEARPTEPLGWRWDPERRSLQLTPALARLLDLPEAPGVRAALRRLAPRDRRLARAALRRLDAASPTTAVAHVLPDAGRVVEHLQYEPRARRLHALVEPLGAAPDAGAALRDALAGPQDVAGAQRWLERRLGDGAGVTVLLIAFDRFEEVNAAHGRAAGDSLLRAAARRIADAVREPLGRGALVARMGGPEFLVASDRGDDAAIEAARVRALDALARPFVVGGAMLPLRARAGFATGDSEGGAAALLRTASESLAQGSAGGATPPLDRLASQIRRALDEGEIHILFQPQVAIARRAIAGAEALARWHHPELGLVDPETLFAAAQRAGLDLALSEHVQRIALETAARWPATLGALRLSINVTAGDVARPDFADRLLGRIDASGFPRARLTVEITESSIMEELGEAARLLAQLRTAGCRVAIDDFGTGYSSLAYLKALPLDYLKIDKKLSQDIAGSPRDRIVVRGVIDMARSLGLSVIAEGVENEMQLELLAKEGCQYYQGYLCAEPLDVAALSRLMEEER